MVMATEQPPALGVLFIRRVPRRTKARFKAWCDLNNVTMTEAIIELIRGVTDNRGLAVDLNERVAKRRRTR